MFNVGVIGCGYWGPNLIRNFSQLNRTRVTTISDLETKRLDHMKTLYSGVDTTTDYLDIINDEKIDIVAVATPVHTHFKFASEALSAGKHVFVEKPMTASVEEAEKLISLARENGCKLMVGHTFLYTAAVRKMKKIVESGELGEIYYINSQRLNLGLFQKDINVIWDLAPHDISIINYLLDMEPSEVSAVGASHINPAIEDVATVHLHYKNNVIAFVQCSWLDPDKVRKMTIVGSRKMMVYDDVQATEKIKIYDKAVEVPKHYDTYAEFHYSYKYGDILIPKIDGGEPLRTELSHFVDCIENDTQPLSDGYNGLGVVKVLEKSSNFLKKE
ncbi:MAG: Gfo/Idh/MocA family oxidoreductase [Proteobacteria bacterium]|nr:Gfo/Idh/MocA family oxidoreductase [Pseudomonadota bacterium]MBU1582917.1 Gfo/Idh/MocA family oxidoreductase [Pseudomonadota bacterium]MBU2455344.1 Gfo/Idh/MocA family oxidoreductase [Pseudomonadota bacterium]MBU2627337.1 Gfo/Idh/MocA family oxidoreductase [Pseudomonadota bacterium]